MRSLSRFARRPSPAMAVALLALVISLGGTAGAAVIITSNSQVAGGTISGANPPAGDHDNVIAGSIGAADLHTGAVNNGKLSSNAVTTGKIKDGDVQRADLAPAARGAEAWGRVDALGDLVAGKNIVGVTSPSDGEFCVQLAAGLPASAAVVSPDFDQDSTNPGTNTSQAVFEIASSGANCSGVPAPVVEVLTFVRTWSSGDTALGLQGQGFELVVG